MEEVTDMKAAEIYPSQAKLTTYGLPYFKSTLGAAFGHLNIRMLAIVRYGEITKRISRWRRPDFQIDPRGASHLLYTDIECRYDSIK